MAASGGPVEAQGSRGGGRWPTGASSIRGAPSAPCDVGRPSNGALAFGPATSSVSGVGTPSMSRAFEAVIGAANLKDCNVKALLVVSHSLAPHDEGRCGVEDGRNEGSLTSPRVRRIGGPKKFSVHIATLK